MNRTQASELLRTELNKHNLSDWKIRIIADMNKFTFLGKCVYSEKCIYLNALHIDTHPDAELINTIKHEVAHALSPNHGHDEVWKDKARSIGCDNTSTCGMALSEAAIDAIRSGAILEVEFDEEVVRTPKYKIRRLQDECSICHKVAKEVKSFEVLGFLFRQLDCGHLIKKVLPKLTDYGSLVSNGWQDHIKNCKHNWIKNQCSVCNEFKPFPFQVEGMLALERALSLQRGFGIFDEQGLGKTWQSLALFAFHAEQYAPFLLIGKSGIKYQYYKEILRLLGPKFLPQVLQTGKDGILPGLKAYICSYDLLRRFDRSKWEKAGIKTIILDECQHIKNPDSTRTQEVRELVKMVDHVIPLSGTPWKNRGSELFVALNMIDSYKFSSYKNFVNRWVDYYASGDKYKEGGIRNIKEFREYSKDCFIRRERTEVLPELPLISRNKFYTEIEDSAKKRYDDAVSDFVKMWNQHIIDGTTESFGASSNAIAELQKMRHIIGLAKIPATIEFVQEFLESTNRKLVIFVHHKDVGQILLAQVKALGLAEVIELTSAKSPEERFAICDKFNSTEKIVMIASTLASGEGLNLQTCSDCVMCERQWNPANEEQAEGRFIRIGQLAQAVTATYVIAENAIVDSHLDTIVEMKRHAFHAAMNKGEIPKWNEGDVIKDLISGIISEFNRKK